MTAEIQILLDGSDVGVIICPHVFFGTTNEATLFAFMAIPYSLIIIIIIVFLEFFDLVRLRA